MNNEFSEVATQAPAAETPTRTVVGFKEDNTFLEIADFEECGGEQSAAFDGEEFEMIQVPAAATEEEVLALVEQHFAESEAPEPANDDFSEPVGEQPQANC